MSKGFPPKRLGIWMSEKKSKKLSLTDIEDALILRNVTPVKIDLTSSLDSQGPFHGILHKLTDIIAQADAGHKESEVLLARFEDYIAENPEVIVMDPINRIRTLLDRFKTYSAIQSCTFETNETVFVPAFVVLESNKHNENIRLLRLSKVTFPLVCKPITAHGSRDAHQLTLVFNENGLSQCGFPCVVQSFVNHNAVLHKIFILGDQSFAAVRPSIRNLFASEETEPIHFYTGDISKASSTNNLTIQFEDEMEIGKQFTPSPETIQSIAKTIHKHLGLSLIGVDFVIESTTGRIAIIDINAFPSYDGIDNPTERLTDFVQSQLDKSCIQSVNHSDDFKAKNGIEVKEHGDMNATMNGSMSPPLINNTFQG